MKPRGEGGRGGAAGGHRGTESPEEAEAEGSVMEARVIPSPVRFLPLELGPGGLAGFSGEPSP